MATYIVGDIQACLGGLQALLKKVNFDANDDRLIAVGDLIGRGPQALETLQFLKSLGNSFDTVLGNHDLHFIAIYANIRHAKASDQFDQLLASPEIESYIHWLRQKPLALLLNPETLICHAGLYPTWSFKKALKYSDEISKQLGSENWQKFLVKMYGNQPDSWSKNLNTEERTRFIVNAFTRMRYMKQKIALDFSCKTAPENAPKNLTPWFKVKNDDLKKNQRVIFGHWAALQGNTQTNTFIGLDTGYLWGQSMTMLELETEKRYVVKHQDS
ncbi:symmetrical bis(5'-nucleosyl)-tetraphosphatase [Paraglaciecola sp. L3A3]|uniref:symmetrical bis(5'-nucleosyl)-tetraphosphatase n=1 Tax=Paraglaciecola sp. L3A3 TaxID=2686358 RepID=UPI00131B0AF1|nr:symmetrical bis(5'-nucleosyl)-tetraphosphatase [Paraglaciecola sp. L3A3]